jgi:glycosyltransferase involved in cell wall biosynthesis
VQTLHNYRPICASAQLMRNGHTCHLCVQGSPLWGVVHRCYRNSVVGSTALYRMIAVHRKRRTWLTDVDRYVVFTDFARRLFAEAGFPEERIDVKPNFIVDPGEPLAQKREGVLFVGRLSKEKGIEVLLEAAARFKFQLRVAGEGPEYAALHNAAGPQVVFLGQLSHDSILNEMRRAALVALPSLWYEGFPMVVLEAFACATPVVASRLGALREIVEDGTTGLLFTAGDADELGKCVKYLLSDFTRSRQLGDAARRQFLTRYTPAANLEMLEGVYGRALVQVRNRIDSRSR